MVAAFKRYTMNYLLLIFVVYVAFISRNLYFYPLWDGYYYFGLLKSAVSNVNTLGDFFAMFNFNSHPSMFYSTYMAIGQYLKFDSTIILHSQNIILNIVSSYCFFQTLVFFLGKAKSLEITIVTAIFLFHPLVNASLLNFNLDYPTLIFFSILIFSYVFQKQLLIILSGIMLIFSKETGIILYVSFIFGLYCYQFIAQKKQPKLNIYYLLPLALLIIYFFIRASFSQDLLFSAGYGNSGSIVKELFVFDSKVAISRFLEIFFLNFNSVIFVTLIFCLIKLLFKIQSNPIQSNPTSKNRALFLIVFCFSVYLYISFFLFKMLVHPRYVIVSVYFLLILFPLALNYIVPSMKTRVIILLSYLLLVLCQNYKSIDPISNSIFGTYGFGSHKIINIDGFLDDKYGESKRDALAYNLEFTIIDKLVSKLYKTINVDEHSFVITEDMDHPTLHPKSRNSNIQPTVIIMSDLSAALKNIPNQSEIYYVHLPSKYNPSIGLNFIKKNFTVNQRYIVSIDGYSLTAYSLRKIGN